MKYRLGLIQMQLSAATRVGAILSAAFSGLPLRRPMTSRRSGPARSLCFCRYSADSLTLPRILHSCRILLFPHRAGLGSVTLLGDHEIAAFNSLPVHWQYLQYRLDHEDDTARQTSSSGSSSYTISLSSDNIVVKCPSPKCR